MGKFKFAGLIVKVLKNRFIVRFGRPQIDETYMTIDKDSVPNWSEEYKELDSAEVEIDEDTGMFKWIFGRTIVPWIEDDE